MSSRFARPMESDQQRMMLSNQRDNGWGISPSQSGSSMSTSNDSEGKYESANDSDMFWKDSQQRDDFVTVQKKSSEYGWAVPSKAAGINSWGSPAPFKTDTDGKHVSSWDHAVRRDTATATATAVLGGLGVPRAKSGAQRPLDVDRIGMWKHTRDDSFAVVNAHSTRFPTPPVATENGEEELDDLAHRAAQIHLGKPNPSGKGIWESLPIAVDTAHEVIPLPKTSVTAASESAPPNGLTNAHTKKVPHVVSIPAGRKLTSSIHATAAASANKQPTKDFERKKRNVERGGRRENSGNKARGGAAGQKNENHRENKSGNRKENRWGKAKTLPSTNQDWTTSTKSQPLQHLHHAPATHRLVEHEPEASTRMWTPCATNEGVAAMEIVNWDSALSLSGKAFERGFNH